MIRLARSLFALVLLGVCPALAEELDTSALTVEVVPAFPELLFKRPILVTHAGDGSHRTFVASQLGKVHVLTGGKRVLKSVEEVSEPDVFFDLSRKIAYKDKENEEGFLGMAFHPEFKQNGYFFVFYSTNETPHTSVISRFQVSKDDPKHADVSSEVELFRLPKTFFNHNGGTIVFGPDGYLYIALGDDGARDDTFGNAQKLSTLFGKILRIDIDHREGDKNYAIPKDNPFVDQQGARGEVYAFGLRNPWRIAFDRKTGVLWAADVGQDLWEEVDLIVAGGNYGWNLREGLHPAKPMTKTPQVQGGTGPLIDPIWEYSHDIGKSITGGTVYRGKLVPELAGRYLYADYVTGKVYALDYDPERKRVTGHHAIPGNVSPIMSFGEDEAGEVYLTSDSGRVSRFRSTAKETASER